MKRISKKLHSTRGASILFALLVFMLCAFAGAAALTAAASNAGRFTHAEQDQQQYLSVASAVDLLREEFDTSKLVFTWQIVETRTWQNEDGFYNGSPTYAQGEDPAWTWSGGTNIGVSLLKTLMEGTNKALFEEMFVPADLYEKISHPDSADGAGDEPEPITLTITGSSDDLKDSLDDVHAEVSVDPATYAITVTLWAGENTDRAYETTVLIPAVSSCNVESRAVTSGEGNTGKTETTTTVTVAMKWPSSEAIIQNWEGRQDAETDAE